ncbi:MAG: hypothetical protein RLZZ387_4116 [Chloroflexota bacterium]|jgi:hypothetical protein
MGGSLAIASVTAILKHQIENGLVEQDVSAAVSGEIIVTVQAPDKIKLGDDEERPQINLFLYQVMPNTGLRASDAERQRGQLLSLDLYYLLTAYGPGDYQMEMLLGSAMQVLQRLATLERTKVQSVLAALSRTGGGRIPSPQAAALAASALATQLERIVVVPQFLKLDEMSKLWGMFETRYRPSVVYKVSVVVVE